MPERHPAESIVSAASSSPPSIPHGKTTRLRKTSRLIPFDEDVYLVDETSPERE